MVCVRYRFLFSFILVLIGSNPAWADVFQPAYLKIEQLDEERYSILWKTPASYYGNAPAAEVIMPPSTELIGPRFNATMDGIRTEYWQVLVSGGLEGQPIAVSGLEGGNLDVVVAYHPLRGPSQHHRLSSYQPVYTISAEQSKIETALSYFTMGVTHILGGADHLLFVLCLLLIVKTFVRLVQVITAFTLAHSITLCSAALGWLSVPTPPVEVIIALSIVYLAAELSDKKQRETPRVAERFPWVVAFGFGLLHGLGFAGALSDIGLPDRAVAIALVAFNIGVEVGQLLFVVVCLLLARVATRISAFPSLQARQVTVYGIGSVAAFWTVERLASLWS